MSDLVPRPSARSFWITVAAVLGCFLVFALVLYLGYLPSREMPQDPAAGMTREQRLDQNILTPQERAERLAEMHRKEATALAGYHWLDQPKGVVELPIERAMELTVRELQERRQQDAAQAAGSNR